MNKKEREEREKTRFNEMLQYENMLKGKGSVTIGGVDEVGRGPLAGPVVAACVVLGDEFSTLGIDDSKKISEKKRERLYEEIMDNALAVGIGQVEHDVIDEINILEATKKAMREAVANCDKVLQSKGITPMDTVIFDAISMDNFTKEQLSLIKGDAKSLSVAAASIVAKVCRDRQMIEYNDIYNGYGFDRNKGYGTKEHVNAIREIGICKIHRLSFLKNILNK